MAEYDSAIPPGGSGQVVARVKTSGIRGARRKTVTLHTNDPDRPTVVLTVIFESRTAVAVMPRPSLVLTTRLGKTARGTLVLRREDGAPLEVRGVSSSVPELAVSAVRAGTPESEGARTPVAVRDGDWLVAAVLEDPGQPFERRGELRIETDHPDLPVLIVPASVRVIGPVRAHPPSVLLEPAGGAEPSVARVSLRHAGRRAFRVVAVELAGELPGAEASVVEDAAGKVQTVEVRLRPADARPGQFHGELVATTDLPRAPTMRIPVTLRVSAAALDTSEEPAAGRGAR